MKKETIELMVIFAALIGFILLANWNRIRKLNTLIHKGKILDEEMLIDFEIINVSSEYVYLRTNAGSMIDYGLREDMDVRGAGTQTLIGNDNISGMVFQVRVKDGEEPQRVARRLEARHSMRVNPTTDWSGRKDFNDLLD